MAVSPKPKGSKKVVGLVIVVLCVCIVLFVNFLNKKPMEEIVGGEVSHMKSKGPVDAPIQIREFIDFQCPMCVKGSVYLRNFMKKYPDLVHLELKYFPLNSIHAYALLSSQYTECALQQGKFWQMHDEIVDNQKVWSKSTSARVLFREMAKDIGLDENLLNVCLEDKDVVTKIMSDRRLGSDLKVKSTPTYFVNGEMFVGLKSLTKKLEAAANENKN